MKRISFWFLSSLSALVLLFGYHTSTSSTLAATSPTSVVSGTTGGGSKAGTGSSSASGSGSGTGSSSSGSSGSASRTTSTVTGSVASTQWGPVQVQLVLQGDTITKVNVLQYPSGNSRDSEINGYA